MRNQVDNLQPVRDRPVAAQVAHLQPAGLLLQDEDRVVTHQVGHLPVVGKRCGGDIWRIVSVP